MHPDKLEENRRVNFRNKWFMARERGEKQAFGSYLVCSLLVGRYDVTGEREALSGYRYDVTAERGL